MKKLITLLTTLALAGFANAGILLGGVDLGQADDFIDDTGVLSGEQAEIDWVNFTLANTGSTTQYENGDFSKDEDVGYQITDDGLHLAFSLDSDPGHYLVKNSTSTALFSNNAFYNWAVIALADLHEGFNIGTDKLIISHVSSFGGSVSVPEPATFGLFALGLVGLSAARRRKTA